MSLFLVGGYGDNQTDAVWSYDTDLDAWTALAACPTADYAVGTKIGDALFVWHWNTPDTAERYDSPSWSSITAPSGEGSAACSLGGLAYVLTEQGFWSYDPILDIVTQLASPPPGDNEITACGLVADADNNVLWSFGGQRSITDNPTFRYNVADDTWDTFTDDPAETRRSMFAAGVLDRRVLIAGGWSEGYGAPLDSASWFDLDTHAWSAAPSLPAPLAECQGGWDGTKFYVFGGYDGAAYTPTGYIYDSDLDSWSTLGSVDFDSDSAGWPAVLGGDAADITPPAPPPRGRVRALWYEGEQLTTPTAPLTIAENSATWTDPVTEVGEGEVQFQNAVADLISTGDLIAFDIADGLGGWVRAWVMLIGEGADYDRTRVGRSIGVQRTTFNAPGHLAVTKSGLIYPTLGLDAFPLQVDMYYDWRHKDFDRSSWVPPTSIISMSDAQTPGAPDWGHSALLVWSPNFPAGPPPFPDPDIIWASSGSLTDAPVGFCLFAQLIDFPFDMTYVMWLAGDNRAYAYLDAVQIGQTNAGGSSPDTAGWVDTQSPIWFRASAGQHLLAIYAENTPRSDAVPGNPAGVAWNIFIPGYPVTLDMCIAHSNTSDVVMLEYPSEPPGMSPWNAVRLAVEACQARGELLNVTLGWISDDLDSAGQSWPTPYPTISTKVLNDIKTFLGEVGATYADVWMDRNSFELQLFVKDTMNAVASGQSFLPGTNIEGLSQRGTFEIVNALIGVTEFGFHEATDGGSIAAHGRKPQRFDIGAVDNPFEAERVLVNQLARLARVQEEISAQVDGPLGYLDYVVGNTAPTRNRAETLVTERIVAIAVRMSKTGRAQTTPILKDLFLT